MRERLRRALPALVGLALFLGALEVLRHELSGSSWTAILASLRETPRSRIRAALALTAVNYVELTAYDFLAFAAIGRRLAPWRIGLTSFLAYAVANNIGFAVLSGASVRYRFYTRWGLDATDLSRLVFSYSITFWLGLLALGGLSLALGPLPRVEAVAAGAVLGPIGWLLFASSVLFVVFTALRRAPIHLGRLELPLPTPRIAAAQWVVSSVDWVLAGAVLFVLLPGPPPFFAVIGAFLAAQLIGLVSHVPGGAGVFESLIVLLLRPYLSSGDLVAPLVLYRVTYYLLPLSIALVALLLDEVHQRRLHAARTAVLIGRLAEQLAPRVLSVLTFGLGVVLLFSGATPAAEGRLRWLDRFVPLGIIETSHFLGSLVGALLLLLSQGLSRRLDAAYHLTVGAVALGIGASLLKGADVEEAVLLTLLLVFLRRAQPAFDRRGALLETRFSAAWIASVAAALSASIWLGLFAFKHVEYSTELWWQFELTAEAPRFLRASVGVALLALIVAVRKLVGPAPHEVDPPTDRDLADAAAIVMGQTSTTPYLVFLRDKGLVFDDDRRGFVMYGVQGRTWVAMGDPVGPPELVPVLLRAFLERADELDGTPVFYEVRKDYLHHYADFGLTFLKLGEEARVELARVTLEGSAGYRHRQALRRLEKEGAAFRIVPAGASRAMMTDLRRVSDDWLGARAAAEKGFSLGSFDPEYLSRFPIALIERTGHIHAFANVWAGPGREELSVDLMRYDRDAPKGVMESLLVHLLLWGKDEGYRWFSLGMAPMSGFEQSPVAPLWARVGTFLYEHGEAVYNFQGLRAFKEKFDPVWEPRYLAYPGGLRLPRVLADVTALIAGGYRRIFTSPRDRASRPRSART